MVGAITNGVGMASLEFSTAPSATTTWYLNVNVNSTGTLYGCIVAKRIR